MKTPYNTGKVKIGSNYHPDLRPAIDADMEFLQTAFIGNISKIKRQRAAWAVYISTVIFVVFGIFLFT
jgi:hypothetical protein